MEHRTHGIILRTRPLTETSLIVNWLTPDLGRISTVAKGARRPKSAFRGKLDLFFTCEFSFNQSQRSDLHTLREVVLINSRPVFRRELAAFHRACYATTFIEQVTETATPILDVARLFEEFLDAIALHPGELEYVPAFELKMLDALGLAPDLSTARLSEGARRIAGHLAADAWPALAILKPTPVQLRELYRFLHGFLGEHLDRLPRGREASWGAEI